MNAPRVDRNLAGYCGIYCGACDIHCLDRKGQATGTAPQWSDMPERLRKHLPVRNVAVKCDGCRSDVLFAGCAYCSIRGCAKKRGIVSSCAECVRYPCIRYLFLKILMTVGGYEKKLPHVRPRQAMCRKMAIDGVDAWLVEQDVHYRCPDCKTHYSWYTQVCDGCGRDLSDLDRFRLPVR